MAETIRNLAKLAIIVFLAFMGCVGQAKASAQSDFQSCVALRDGTWTPTERLVWRELCYNGIAGSMPPLSVDDEKKISNSFDRTAGDVPQLSVHDEKAWKANNKIPGSFISQILTERKYQNALDGKYLRFYYVSVEGEIFIHSKHILNSVYFISSPSDLDLKLDTVKSDGGFGFFLDCIGSIIITDSSLNFLGISDTSIRHSLLLTNSYIKDNLDISDLEPKHSDNTKKTEDNATNTEFNPNIGFDGTTVSGSTSVKGGQFPDGLSFDRSVFDGNFLLDHDTICIGAQGCDLSLDEASFMGGLSITNSMVGGIIDAEGIDVAHSISFYHDGDLAIPFNLNLEDSDNLKDDVTITNSTLGAVDLAESTITKKLDLEGDTWFNGSFDFSDGSVGTIENPTWDWPLPANVNIAGLSYNSIDHGKVDLDHKGCIGGSWVKWFTDYDYPPLDKHGHFWRPLGIWLQLVPSYTVAQYTAQPYDDLAKMLKNTNHAWQATCVLESSADIQNSRNSGLYHLGLWLYGQFDGYGYNPGNAAWSLVLVPLGMIVLWRSGEGRRNNMSIPIGFFYSLSTFIPLVNLDKRFDDFELHGFARGYFYVHKIIGYIVGLCVLAALTSITNKAG